MNRTILTIALLSALNANAGMQDIDAVNNESILSSINTSSSYKETGDGVYSFGTLDTENGVISGGSYEYRTMSSKARWFLTASGSIQTGDTTYIGSYQTGKYGDVVTNTFNRVSDFDFTIGKGWRLNDDSLLLTYIDVDIHTWDRILTTTIEAYSGEFIGLGLTYQYSPVQDWVFAIDYRQGVSSAGITATDTTAGFTAQLKDKPWQHVGASIDYKFADKWHIVGGIERVMFGYGASDWVYTSNKNYVAMEPDSTTQYVTTKIGIGFEF